MYGEVYATTSNLEGVAFWLPSEKSFTMWRMIRSGFLSFLLRLGKKVIIIGGGNVAMDCAKTAVRKGVEEVHVLCLEKRDLTDWDRMPAHHWEIEEAEEEGIVINPSLGPKRILVENGVLQTVEEAFPDRPDIACCQS